VAEADPWGGNENNKEKKSQRYGKFMGLYLFSIKEFAKKPFFFPFPLEVKELIALGSNSPKSRDLAVQYSTDEAELFQNQVSNRRWKMK